MARQHLAPAPPPVSADISWRGLARIWASARLTKIHSYRNNQNNSTLLPAIMTVAEPRGKSEHEREARGGVALTRSVGLTVNGTEHAFALPLSTPLIYVLRNDLALNGPKFGCGLGECGACTVLVDGIAARSCVVTLGTVEGRSVVTLEGLGTPEAPHPVQSAFITEQAAQCGYCLNGMIMTTTALLARTPDPSEAEVRAALRFNLCRCGTHVEILRAVMHAARLLADQPIPDATLPVGGLTP